jgi:hypothetical protein
VSSDPNLLDTTEFERRLLEAAGAERPPAELSARMAGALGLPPSPGLGPLPTAKLGGGWLSVGVIAAALGGAYGAWTLAQPAKEASSPAPAVSSVKSTALDVSPQSVIEPPAAAPVEPLPPAPANSQATLPRGSKGSSEANAAPERGDLREEIRLIDAVRSALAAHAPAEAQSLLKRYAARFPGGTFAQEAAVLRIEALEQSGQHQKARALSRDFQSKHPSSPLSERLRRLSAN